MQSVLYLGVGQLLGWPPWYVIFGFLEVVLTFLIRKNRQIDD